MDLTNIINRLSNAQIGHFKEYEKHNKYHHILSLPILILSIITNFGVFYQFDLTKIDFLMSIFLFSTLSVTLLSGFHTYLKSSDSAQSHKVIAAKYGKLKREIELINNMQLTDIEFNKRLEDVYKEWNATAEIAPVTSMKIIKEVLEEIKGKPEQDD